MSKRIKPTIPRIIKDAMLKRGVGDSYAYVSPSISVRGRREIEKALNERGLSAARGQAYQIILQLYPR